MSIFLNDNVLLFQIDDFLKNIYQVKLNKLLYIWKYKQSLERKVTFSRSAYISFYILSIEKKCEE